MNRNIQLYEQSYFASSSTGLESLLSKELQSLGAKKVTLSKGGAEFKGDVPAIKAILNLRTASRVIKKICSFELLSEKDIYSNAINIKWDNIFSPQMSFKVHSIISDNSFKNSMYLSQILKDAVVDKFRKISGQRPNIDTEHPDVTLILRAERHLKGLQRISIFVDLCGSPLHERGYRVSTVTAPLKENLAAGILLLSGWGAESGVLIDTMCGSGTFLIEGAMIKYDIPPSFIKINKENPWAIKKLKFLSSNISLSKAFDDEILACKKRASDGLQRLKKDANCIYGLDLDKKAVNASNENLLMAGMKDSIKVELHNSLTAPTNNPEPRPKSIVICNPPYGERIGDIEKLDELYYLYGENLKNNFKGYDAVVFTGNMESAKKIALKPILKTPLFNGRIECRLLKYPLY
jgi:putative N6-adenine-specific DNA methylase